MAYSDNFPAVLPQWQCNFAANGGRLEPRINYTRASSANVWDGSKHLSSENVFLQSSDFDTTWSKQGLEVPTGGQADPAGGTDGFTLEETSGANFHHIWQSPSVTGSLALTVYAKQNSGTRYVYLTIWNAVNDWQVALFDLAGGAPATSNGSASTFTGVTAAQTASGGGYYKCTLKATGTASVTYVGLDDSSTITGYSTGYGVKSYTGDGTSSIDVAFASLSTTGATDYNATTTQIHREYASSLVSKANNIGRFEVGTDGQSMGVLIEGQSQNLLPSGATGYNSSNVFNWNTTNANFVQNAAVAPTGSLEATHFYENSATTTQHRFDTVVTATAAAHTLSGYFKTAGRDDIVVRVANDGNVYGGQFTFSTQATSNYGTAFSSLSISSVGNGWYRFVATTPTLASGSTNIFINLFNGAINYTGDAYSGVMFYGLQFEAGAASSLISTVDSAVTRAADSMSVTDASLFGSGSGAVVVEAGPVSGTFYPTLFDLTDTTTSNRVLLQSGGTGTPTSLTVAADGNASVGVVSEAVTMSDRKFAVSYDTNSFKLVSNGGAVSEDTSGQLPQQLSKLNIGTDNGGGGSLNGNIKRIAVFGEPLSDTNLQALTS